METPENFQAVGQEEKTKKEFLFSFSKIQRKVHRPGFEGRHIQ